MSVATTLLEWLPQLNEVIKCSSSSQGGPQTPSVDSPTSADSVLYVDPPPAAETSLALPKRAETFSGFDNKDKRSPCTDSLTLSFACSFLVLLVIFYISVSFCPCLRFFSIVARPF